MISTLRLSARNLMRYQRRTLLTALLIMFGVMALLIFVAAATSFKQYMVGNITDSMLAHLQVHKKGYTAAIDNLPLNQNLGAGALAKIEEVLKANPAVLAYSKRIKLGAMFSNFNENTSIRLNGIDPQAEDATVPGLRGRISDGKTDGPLVVPGEILVPTLLAKGMKVKVGDTVVLVATNSTGSVNGKNFIVRGILEQVTGPGGRDGYMHQADARELLRMEKPEAMEVALRIGNPDQLDQVKNQLAGALAEITNKEGKPVTELHTWEQLSPFSTIVKMIDLMTLFIRIMLVSIVLVSVMNVMLMAVYERIREIGTLSAIGTPASRIMGLFVGEGLLLGLIGALAGIVVSYGITLMLNIWPVSFAYGRDFVVLHPVLAWSEIGWVLLAAILVSALASLQPAWRASRMDPIQALRHI
jgi:putative ABC transport system permease protein